MQPNTTETARNLYGLGWNSLPEFVKESAADFIADLLDITGTDIDNDNVADRVHECADRAVPVYDYQRYALLNDTKLVNAIEDALNDYGTDAATVDGQVSFSAMIGLGIYGAVSNALHRIVYAFDANNGTAGIRAAFAAFGMDDDAADVAAALLPEWAGTIRELIESAPKLAVTQ
jgi:hypothetical protein